MPYDALLAYMNQQDAGGFRHALAAELDRMNALPGAITFRSMTTNYFNEATVVDTASRILWDWVAQQDAPGETWLIGAERLYANNANGPLDRADLWVRYRDDDDIRNCAIEVKASFSAEVVNADIEKLETAVDENTVPRVDNGYAVYVVKDDDQGWTNQIDQVLSEDVARVPVIVQP